MERRFSPLVVVLLWMAFNTVLAVVLVGFIAVGHQTGMLEVAYYFGFMSVIAGIAVAVWLVRRASRSSGAWASRPGRPRSCCSPPVSR